MSSLADLADLRGFFSYSREDDEDSHGSLSALRDRIQRELRSQLGRPMKSFGLWQDKEAIAPGTQWEAEIKNAVAQSVFFIPIITPTVIKSQYCRFELESFLSRQATLDRNDLVFPILYINVAALNDIDLRQKDPVLAIIAERQYEDWRQLRHWDLNSREIKEAIERFCRGVSTALQRSWLSPEDRKRQEEAGSLQLAEAERKRQEAKAERQRATERAEADRRRRETEREPPKADRLIPDPETTTQEEPPTGRTQTRNVAIATASLIALATIATLVVKFAGGPIPVPPPQAETPVPTPQMSTPSVNSGTTASGRPILKFN
jgi:TIR domain